MGLPQRAGFDPRQTGCAGSLSTHVMLATCIALAAILVLVTAVAPARAAPQRDLSQAVAAAYAPGTIVISQSARRLFLVTEDGYENLSRHTSVDAFRVDA